MQGISSKFPNAIFNQKQDTNQSGAEARYLSNWLIVYPFLTGQNLSSYREILKQILRGCPTSAYSGNLVIQTSQVKGKCITSRSLWSLIP